MDDQQTNSSNGDASDAEAGAAKSNKNLRRRLHRGWLFCCLVPGGALLGLLLAGWWLLREVPVASVPRLPPLEDKLARGVRRELDLPADAEVEMEFGKAAETLAGQLPSFHVESTTATLGDLPCELLLFDATDVGFNVKDMLKGEKAKIMSFGSAKLTLRVGSQELKTRLIPLIEKQGLKEPRIEFGAGTVKVTAKRKIKLLGSVKLSAKGQFYTIGENGIGLKLNEIETGQLNVGVSKLDLKVDDVLPPLDLGGMFAKIVIDDLDITSEYLQVTAHAVEIAGDSIPQDAINVM